MVQNIEFQLYLVTRLLSMKNPSRAQLPSLVFMTSSFMITWQFAQFALLTQTASVMGTYLLGFIGSKKLRLIVEAQEWLSTNFDLIKFNFSDDLQTKFSSKKIGKALLRHFLLLLIMFFNSETRCC